jgi:hypothetical protein
MNGNNLFRWKHRAIKRKLLQAKWQVREFYY